MHQVITFYQLSSVQEGTALFIAEVQSLQDHTIQQAAIALVQYIVKHEYIEKDVSRCVLTFIRHEQQSTKSFECEVIQHTQSLGTQVTNKLMQNALRSGKATGAFVIDVASLSTTKPIIGCLEPASESGQFDLAYLANYLDTSSRAI